MAPPGARAADRRDAGGVGGAHPGHRATPPARRAAPGGGGARRVAHQPARRRHHGAHGGGAEAERDARGGAARRGDRARVSGVAGSNVGSEVTSDRK